MTLTNADWKRAQNERMEAEAKTQAKRHNEWKSQGVLTLATCVETAGGKLAEALHQAQAAALINRGAKARGIAIQQAWAHSTSSAWADIDELLGRLELTAAQTANDANRAVRFAYKTFQAREVLSARSWALATSGAALVIKAQTDSAREDLLRLDEWLKAAGVDDVAITTLGIVLQGIDDEIR